MFAASTLSRGLSLNIARILAALLGVSQGLQSAMAWKAGGASPVASAALGAGLALVATVGFGSALRWWHLGGGHEWLAHRSEKAPRWFLISFILLAVVAVLLGAVLASIDWP